MKHRLLFLGLALVGCSSPSNPAAPDAGTVDEGGTVTCENDPRVQPYTVNLTKASTSGALKVTIVSGDPAPPIVGTNTWMVKAVDGTGAPLTTPPKVDPFMPDHNHGPSVKAQATAQADGSFQVTPIDFIMAGVWRVTFSGPSVNGAAPESVAFFFCVSD
jgi:hypothetical protein